MYSRWFNLTVVVLWLSTMSWLVWEKVIPPLREGEPPSYQTIVQAQKENPLVGWKMLLNGRQLGWALSEALTLENDLTEIHSQVHFDQLPLRELIPRWLRVLLPPISEHSLQSNLRMNTQSTLTIDPLGRLTSFRSTVKIDPLDEAIKMQGTVEGTQLKVTVSSSEFSHSTEAYLPEDALVADAFSPLTQLPDLHEGQTWPVPVYSPLRPPGKPMEILVATVERIEPLNWNGRAEDTWLVVYRRDSGFGLGSRKTPRGRLWVRRDGTVLKQQVMLLDFTMTFVRMTDEEAADRRLLPTTDVPSSTHRSTD